MDIKINVLSESENEIEALFSPEEIADDIEKEVAKQVKTIKIDGFRPGKVPIHIIKQMYGNALEYTAAEKVSNKKFQEIVKEKNIRLLNEPIMTDFKFEPGKDLFFKVKYEILPKIELKEYKGIEIEIPDFLVSDKAINEELNRLLIANAEFEDAEVVENKNYKITVDLFKYNDDGKLSESASEKNLEISLLNERVNQQLVEGAIGKKVGDFFEFSFEDHHHHEHEHDHEHDHNHEHHHEVLHFQAVINDVKKILLPELSDEFIIKITRDKAKNENELREQIRKDIQSYYDSNIRQILIGQLQYEIIKRNDFNPPSTLINNYLDNYVKTETEKAAKNKKKLDTKVLREKFLPQAVNLVKWYLIIDAIKNENNITVTDEFIENKAKESADMYGVKPEVLKSYFSSDEMKKQFLDEVVIDFLISQNNIKKVDPEQFNKKEKS